MDNFLADQSVLSSVTGRSLLADSSVFITETSKENIFTGSDGDEEMPQIETRVVLVQEAGKDEELLKALEEIKVPFIKTETVEEFGDADCPEFETVFVLSDFQNPIFSHLYKAECRILGPPIVLYCSQKGEPLPFTSRPLYSPTMLNLVLCFTGFRQKEELVKLVNLVHHMGGTIKRDFSSKVTHLVASSTHGDKFRVAVSLGTPIMKTDWILKAWEKRNELGFCAANDTFRNEFKVPPFQDCVLSFLGFSDEEKASMEEMAEMQGGQCLPVGDEKCSHLVVEENTVKELPFEPSKKLYVVKQEWFWGSIQMDARAGETMYSFEKPESPALKKSVSLLSLGTPNGNRKKRRLRDTLAQFTRETDLSPFPPRKRPSAEHSLSIGSLLDISNTPDAGKSFPGSRIGIWNACSDRGQANSHQIHRCSQSRRNTRKMQCRSERSNTLLDSSLTPVRHVHPIDIVQHLPEASSKSCTCFRVPGEMTMLQLQRKVLFPNGKDRKAQTLLPHDSQADNNLAVKAERFVNTNRALTMLEDATNHSDLVCRRKLSATLQRICIVRVQWLW